MAFVPFTHLSRESLDEQLSPSRTAKDPWGVLRRHEAVTAGLDDALDALVMRDLAYGGRPAERFDLVVPSGRGPCPCLVYFHGGFWQEGSKAGSGFAAPALVRAGCALAAVGYTLAPAARLRTIVAEAGAALVRLHQEAPSYGLDPGRLFVAGHSAGAHLAAAIVAGMAGEAAASAVAGAVLVSGVYDLAPVAASYVNDRARLDEAEVLELSPLTARPWRDVPVHVVVGADEPEAFLLQADALVAAWRPHVTRLTARRAPGRDHFDVLDELTDPGSPTFLETVAMMLEKTT